MLAAGLQVENMALVSFQGNHSLWATRMSGHSLHGAEEKRTFNPSLHKKPYLKSG